MMWTLSSGLGCYEMLEIEVADMRTSNNKIVKMRGVSAMRHVAV